MATREVAIGGTVLAGGGAGGGYAAYRYLGGSSEEEEIKDKGSEVPSTTSTTIQQQLTTDSSSTTTGKPIGIDNNGDQWKKSHHRYFLEVKDSEGDKIDALKGENIRDDKYEDKSDTLKTECEKLFKLPYKGEDDNDYKKAKKWCTTYKTVKETLDNSKQNKNLKEDTESGWNGKYDAAAADATLKKVLDGLKKEFTSGSDDDKKKKAVRKWCTMALDASENYQFKEKVETVCVFKD